MRKGPPRKSLIALAAIGMAAVFGSSSCQAPPAPGPQGVQTGVNVLFRTDMIDYDWHDADWIARGEFGYYILNGNGKVEHLNRNDASNNHELSNVISCKNGNAILEGSEDYFLFDAQNKEIVYKGEGNTPFIGDFVVIVNSNNEPVGIASPDPAQDQLVVVFCNGDYVATNECAPNCSLGSNTPTSVTYYTDKEVFSIPVPSSLASLAVDESPQGLLKRQKVKEPTNTFAQPIVSGKYTIYPEINTLNELVRFVIVDNATGDISVHPVSLSGPVGPSPYFSRAVDTPNGTFFYFGKGNTRYFYGNFDGNSLTLLGEVDGTADSVVGGDLGGSGPFYFIRSSDRRVIHYIDTGGNSGSSNPIAANAQNAYNGSTDLVLGLSDGVAVYDGTNHYTYRAGDTDATQIPSADSAPLERCRTGTVLRERTTALTCYDPAVGDSELAFLPDITPGNWTLVNPDGRDDNNWLTNDSAEYGHTGQAFFVRESNATPLRRWIMCPVGQSSCSFLQNVNGYDVPQFTAQPSIVSLTGYFARTDLLNDDLQTFVWSHGSLMAGSLLPNWDLTAIADIGQAPNSACGYAGLGDTIAVEKLGSGQYHEIKVSSIPDDTSSYPMNVSYMCVSAVIGVWY